MDSSRKTKNKPLINASYNDHNEYFDALSYHLFIEANTTFINFSCFLLNISDSFNMKDIKTALNIAF